MALSLERILKSTRQIKDLLHNSRSSSRPPHAISLPSDYTSVEADAVFPQPASISSKLLQLGVGREKASQISGAYMKYAAQCRDKYVATHAKMRHEMSLSTPGGPQATRVAEVMQRSYFRALEQLSSRCMESAKRHTVELFSEALCLIPNPNILLEYYFSHKSSTPSRTEKLLLAQKTGKTLHQIDIWFQNKRRRARTHFDEKGKPVYEPCSLSPTQVSDCARLLSPLDPNSDNQSYTDHTGISRYSLVPPTVSESPGTFSQNPLDAVLPVLHGFEVSDTFDYTEHLWRRCASSPPQHSSSTPKDLAADLDKLTIEDHKGSDSLTNAANGVFLRSPYHPAISQSSGNFQLRTIHHYPIVRAKKSCLSTAFMRPTPVSNLQLLSQVSNCALGKRKCCWLEPPQSHQQSALSLIELTPVGSPDAPSDYESSLAPTESEEDEQPVRKRARVTASYSSTRSRPLRTYGKGSFIASSHRVVYRQTSCASVSSGDSPASSQLPTPTTPTASLSGCEVTDAPPVTIDAASGPQVSSSGLTALGLCFEVSTTKSNFVTTSAESLLGKQDGDYRRRSTPPLTNIRRLQDYANSTLTVLDL